MIGEIVFPEEKDKVEMLAKIVATLHWAAPIVAKSCRTGVEHIGFFGPRKVVRDGQVLWVYRLARVYGTKPEFLRKNVWKRNAILLDPNDFLRNRLNHVEKREKQATSLEARFESESQTEEAACLG